MNIDSNGNQYISKTLLSEKVGNYELSASIRFNESYRRNETGWVGFFLKTEVNNGLHGRDRGYLFFIRENGEIGIHSSPIKREIKRNKCLSSIKQKVTTNVTIKSINDKLIIHINGKEQFNISGLRLTGQYVSANAGGADVSITIKSFKTKLGKEEEQSEFIEHSINEEIELEVPPEIIMFEAPNETYESKVPPGLEASKAPFDRTKVTIYHFDSTLFRKTGLTLHKSTHQPITGIVHQNYTVYHCDSGKLFFMKQYWGTGNVQKEIYYQDGKRHGKYRTQYIDGQLSEQGFFKHGKKYGRWLYRYENGQMKKESNYVDGKLIGWQKAWSSNGELVAEINLLNGNGTYREYFERYKGKGIAKEVQYINGVKHGTLRFWNEKAILVFESNFSEGKLDGWARKWHDNGQLSQEEFYTKSLYGSSDKRKCWDTSGNVVNCRQRKTLKALLQTY